MTNPADVPLAAMLQTEFEPGSNMCGRLAFADLRYLLPDLTNGRTLHIGLPGGVDVDEFVSRLEAGVHASFLADDPEVTEAVAAEAARRGREGPSIDCLPWSSSERLPLASGSMGLASLGTGPGTLSSSEGSRLASELKRVLRSDGAVTVEARGYRNGARMRALVRHLADAGFEGRTDLWLLTVSGSLRMAVEEGDLDSARHVLAWLGRGASHRRLAFRTGVGLLDRMSLLRTFLTRHRLSILKMPSARTPGGTEANAPRAEGSLGRRVTPGRERNVCAGSGLWPPPYLRSALTEAGLVPDRFRFGFHVHGRYDSNKVAFVLFDRNAKGEPRHIVKATRDPRFNYRLENEHRSLTLVHDEGYLPTHALPHPTFLDHRGGLAVLGLQYVSGRPMREVSQADPSCPWVGQIVEHLEELGAASARRCEGSVDALRSGLESLLGRFLDIYPVPPAARRFLQEEVSAVQEGADTLPLVFQHGDAGIWNVLVDGDRAVLLDWEVGEPSGMPLWDLYYFLRSVGSWSSRLRGNADLIDSYEEHFLNGSPLGRFAAEVVGRYVRRLNMDPDLATPLLHTCWIHRALRESMQMQPDEVDGGLYYRLLIRSIRVGRAERA